MTVLDDIPLAIRSLLRAPALVTTLVLSIGVGIGSNIAVHGFASGLTAPEGRAHAASGVVSIFTRDASAEWGLLSLDQFDAIQRLDRFAWVAAAHVAQHTVQVAEGRREILTVASVSSPMAGLFDISLDEGPVISHRTWVWTFSGRDVSEREIRIGDVAARIAGVAPRDLEGLYAGRTVDLWRPFDPEMLKDRATPTLWVVAQLRPGVTIDDARAAIERISAGRARFEIAPFGGLTPDLTDAFRRLDGLLGIAAALVLVVALGNVASLLIGRSTARAAETSMRLALGASRAQLTRRVMIESSAIAAAGAALGTLVAAWMARAIPALLFVDDAARVEFAPETFQIAAIATLGAAITIVSGLAPALAIPFATPAAVLRRESAGASPVIKRIRQAMLVAQLACCCALVITAGLIVERLRAAGKTEVAHGLGEAVLATVNADPNVGLRYFEDIERAAAAAPLRLRALGWTATLPGTQPTWRAYRAEPPGLASRTLSLDSAVLTKDTLRYLALPPSAGRLFNVDDQGCAAAVANEAAARTLFGAQTVGRTIEDPTGRLVEIVGVVRERPRGTIEAAPRLFYPDAGNALPEPSAPVRVRAAVATPLPSVMIDTRVVSDTYFDVMRAAPVAGQIARGDRHTACRVGVLNRQAADLYFGGTAVGGAIIDDVGQRTEIIGVVGTPPVGAFERRIEPAVFLPMAQDWVPQMTLMLGASSVDDELLAELRQQLNAVPGRGRVPNTVKSLETYLGQTALAPLRIATAIVAVFAAVAVVLAVIGLHGALADAARRRNRELGLRIALGARQFDVVLLILGEGGRLVLAGSVVGLAGALLLSQRLSTVVASVPPARGWLWIAGPLLLALAVIGASVLPARRGSMVDPIVVLREGQ